MPLSTRITIAPELIFDALVAGEAGAPPVLLLHGFAESMHGWRAQLDPLADTEVLAGVGHFAADQAPDRVSELLLGHLRDHPA